MRHLLLTVGALALTGSAAMAGGLDRSGQSVSPIFEPGKYAELSFGLIRPNVDGNDVAAFGGGYSGDVGGNYSLLGFAYKQDFNDKLSFAVIGDQPFGADVVYGAGSVALGGTSAQAKSYALTGIMRYKFDGGFSAHAGLRAQRAEGQIDLRGLAYGGVNGYSVDLAPDMGYGYLVGVAYEKPEIALRVALTYNSAVKHEFDTVETLGGVIGTSPTEVETPQSVNLDFQSGIAKDTLIFGSIRWAEWSEFQINPPTFTTLTGSGLVDLDNTVTWTLGVGRRFNENWAASLSFQYEKEGDPLVSPLSPTNGRMGVTLGTSYTKDNMKISVGINYTKLGDASPETGTPDVARANFTDNHSVGIGFKIGYSF